MADFGLQGTPGGSDKTSQWVAQMHGILDLLPPVFSTVWSSDHLQQFGEPWPEGWTRLAYLAAAEPRFRYGHLVLSQSYRNPGLLGAMAATLQELSQGRFILGLGAGWLEEEYRAFNFDYPSGGTRVAQLAEAMELIRILWTETPATYHGEWYHLDQAVCAHPDPAIPILVGTNGQKALRVVARLADWWNWDGPWDVSYREPFERLRSECEAIGRPFDQITLTASLSISMPDDPSTFQPTYEHGFYPGQEFGNVGPTAGDVIREIERLVDVGVRHFPLAFDSVAELRRFVDEVVPHVRLEPANPSGRPA
jgi:alkanesulfonate monooxygenase SsuD/methylene tetrahydromethanopterin reductase-like flavin-dependent oxidoreductase (luciferase family)